MPGKVKRDKGTKSMRIGELAQATGTTTKTLRFYEDQGLLPHAERTASGYRDYTPESLGRLDCIRRGQAAGLTLAQIRQILGIRDSGMPPCEHVRDRLDERLTNLDTQIAQLVALRDILAQLRDQAADAEPETCPPDQVCRYL